LCLTLVAHHRKREEGRGREGERVGEGKGAKGGSREQKEGR
jgi:hypothetical protein